MVPTEDIMKMAEYVLKKVFLSLISTFSNKYVEPLLVVFSMDFIETEFLKTLGVETNH